MRALVFGVGITGVSVARALQQRGYVVKLSDDTITPATHKLADELGLELLPSTAAPAAAAQLDAAAGDLLSPAPGVPETHPVIVAVQRAGVPVVSEIELAYRWEQNRPGGPRPLIAITGTDGKTTTTELVVAMLTQAGHRTMPLGNNETPLVDAIDGDLDVLVVECSSFRLHFTEQFRADGAIWLNLAPDHLNWHTDIGSYERAKARIFNQQSARDVAVGFGADPVVARHLADAPGRSCTFGSKPTNDYRVVDGELVGPSGVIGATTAMQRALPHDITNALAAAAVVLETGLATAADVMAALRTFSAPRHRLQLLGQRDGVSWYNDSKATTPHAAAVAIAAFDSLVLIAGGKHKHVPLDPMGAAASDGRVRATVAIGDAAAEVQRVMAPHSTVVVIDGRQPRMDEAIRAAHQLARPGDAVVLAPGCASFDWYKNFEERGDDFIRRVQQEIF